MKITFGLLILKNILFLYFTFNRPKENTDAKTFKQIKFEVPEKYVIIRFYWTQQTASLIKNACSTIIYMLHRSKNSELIREVTFGNDSNIIYSVSKC